MSQEILKAKLESIQLLVTESLALLETREPKRQSQKIRKSSELQTGGPVNFQLNNRAFIKRYSKGFSGPQKFVLLLAYLTKGDISKEVESSEIERQWNSMTSKGLFGMKYNNAFSVRAKDNGWTRSSKRGFQKLESTWREIFDHD